MLEASANGPFVPASTTQSISGGALTGHRKRLDDQAIVDTDHRKHDRHQQPKTETRRTTKRNRPWWMSFSARFMAHIDPRMRTLHPRPRAGARRSARHPANPPFHLDPPAIVAFAEGQCGLGETSLLSQPHRPRWPSKPVIAASGTISADGR